MTRRPLVPTSEKGILVQKVNYSWWEELNTNGDASNIIVQLLLAPIVFPYILIRKILK